MERRTWPPRPTSLGRHIAVVLLAAVIVFVLAAAALWLTVGAPRLPRGAAFTVTNQLELVKLALAVVAGVGGVVALVVAYRRQAVVEEENKRAVVSARRRACSASVSPARRPSSATNGRSCGPPLSTQWRVWPTTHRARNCARRA